MLAAVKPLKTVESTSEHRDFAMPQGSVAVSSELENLFRQHNHRVFHTAQRITGSAADAEDVLQTVFLRLMRGSENLTILENPKGYFTRAAINASLDLLRQRKRSKAVATEDLEEARPEKRSGHVLRGIQVQDNRKTFPIAHS